MAFAFVRELSALAFDSELEEWELVSLFIPLL
jgi:hypothetical protein